MLKVQHLVIDDVLNHIPRHPKVIKDTADDDRVMRRVVMSEHIARTGLTPGHRRPCQQAVEETSVELLENLVQVVDIAGGIFNQLAPAHAANQVCLFANGTTAHKLAIPC